MARINRPIQNWAAKEFSTGDGVHSDIYITACYLLEEGQNQETVFDFIRKGADKVNERSIPDREIWSAIRYADAKLKGGKQSQKWSKADPIFQNEIVKNYPSNLAQLKANAASLPQTQEFYLKNLYDPNSLLCVASNAHNWQTLSRDQAINIATTHYLEYINPSPMSALKGITEEGNESSHCKDNTGERKYLIVEFDNSTLDQQHSYHTFLSFSVELRMLVFSGNKSIHGWYDFSSLGEFEAKNFFESASLLGCDPRTWSVSQFVRIPAGRNNKTHKLQKVIYYNGR